MERSSVRSAAERIALEVGDGLKSAVNGGADLSVQHKGKTDLVTKFDLWAEEIIRRRIRESFPNHTVLGEEESGAAVLEELKERVDQGIVWVVDPIDGTTNFASRIPHFGVSIAVLKDGVREAGIVYDPMRDELFSAARGEGAFLNGSPIQASETGEIIDSVIATGFPYDRSETWGDYRATYEAFLLASRDLRRFGAASLDLCWVACGRLDGYFEFNLKPWDVAAGSLILEEAGGIAGNFIDSEGDRFSMFSRSFLFAGKNVFAKMDALARTAYGRN